MEDFSKSFQNDDAANKYEKIIYNKNSYDSFIWKIQSKTVESIFNKLKNINDRLFHLDFACGTGRVLSLVEDMTGKSTGVDISDNMISLARAKVKHSKLYVGNILDSDIVDGQGYDVITAFRFFLNAEPPLRKKIMTKLISNFNSPESRLIFNIHGNKHSLRHLAIKWRSREGAIANEMSLSEVRYLVSECGLEIESWYGFGFMPEFLHRSKIGSIVRIIDQICAKLLFMKFFSYDLLFVCKQNNKALTVKKPI